MRVILSDPLTGNAERQTLNRTRIKVCVRPGKVGSAPGLLFVVLLQLSLHRGGAGGHARWQRAFLHPGTMRKQHVVWCRLDTGWSGLATSCPLHCLTFFFSTMISK